MDTLMSMESTIRVRPPRLPEQNLHVKDLHCEDLYGTVKTTAVHMIACLQRSIISGPMPRVCGVRPVDTKVGRYYKLVRALTSKHRTSPRWLIRKGLHIRLSWMFV